MTYRIKDSAMKRFLTHDVFETAEAAEKWAIRWIGPTGFVVVINR